MVARSYEDIFVENSSVRRNVVKRRILRDNLIEYKCRKCGNTGEWMGEEVVLHLEHKNGINNDHRLENLEFLCPNCHSQTSTYAGKNPIATKRKEEKRLLKEKLKTKIIVKRKAYLDSIDSSKYGWIKQVCDEWKVSHTQVKRWIRNYYPEFDYFER